MKNAKHAQRLDMAIAWAEEARRKALQRTRTAGDPRNPYRARVGRGPDFDAGKKDAFGLGLVLAELKARRGYDRFEHGLKLADRVLDFLIGVGLAALAALGLAAAFVLLRFPEPTVQIAAIVGVGAALARAVIAARK